MLREMLEQYKRTGRWVRSAIYLRKSRAEEHMSLEDTLGRHLAALTAYAEKYGFLVEEADIYKEVVSGESLFARPQMLRLLEPGPEGISLRLSDPADLPAYFRYMMEACRAEEKDRR